MMHTEPLVSEAVMLQGDTLVSKGPTGYHRYLFWPKRLSHCKAKFSVICGAKQQL